MAEVVDGASAGTSRRKGKNEPVAAGSEKSKAKAAVLQPVEERKQTKKEEGPLVVALNVDMHCEGCAKKVRASLKGFEGIEKMATDITSNKLTVVGKVDPLKLREHVERKVRKKVILLSPSIGITSNAKVHVAAKKETKEGENAKVDVGQKGKLVGGNKEKGKEKVLAVVKAVKEQEGVRDDGDHEGSLEEEEIMEKLKQKGKAKEKGVQKKVEGDGAKEMIEKNKQSQETPAKGKEMKDVVSTVVMKVGLHCQGCTRRIRKTIGKVKGVESVAIDSSSELVTVRGTMDVKAMESYLREKLKRNFDIIPPKKVDNNNGKGGPGAKDVGNNNGNNKKNKKGGPAKDDGDDEDGKENKKEKDGGKSEGGPSKKKGGEGGTVGKKKEGEGKQEFDMGKVVVGRSRMEFYDGGPSPEGYYGVGYAPPYAYQPEMVHAPQMFSDENPNACSIM